MPLSNIRITMYMDTYTALWRTGSIIPLASEALYLNESRGIMKERTWLEEDRLREVESVGVQWLGPGFRAHDIDSSSIGVGRSKQSARGPTTEVEVVRRETTAQRVPKAKNAI